MYKKILIATDGSELSAKAVDSGLALAALSGAEAIVVKVVRRYPRSHMDGAETLDAREAQRVEADWTAHAERELDAIKARGQEKQARVSTEVLHSDLIAESIIGAARHHGCDLIVMASHGRRGLQRLLLGSETQHVLTHTHIPVLVLR